MENLINNKKPSKPKLLWENSSPNSNYGGGTISLDLSKYNAVIIQFRHSGQYNEIAYEYMPIGVTYSIGGFYSDSVAVRGVTTNSTKIVISSTIGYKLSGESGFHLYNGNYQYGPIPQKIYGVSFELE